MESGIAILSCQNEDLQNIIAGLCETNQDLLVVETNPNVHKYKKQVASLVTEISFLKRRVLDLDSLVGNKVHFRDALHQLFVFYYGKFSNYNFFASKLMEQIHDPRFLNSCSLNVLYHIAECHAKMICVH